MENQGVMERRRHNVGGTERWISVGAGGLLLAHGLQRLWGFGALLEAVAGAALLERGATGHCRVYDALGVDSSDTGPAARYPSGTTARHVERAVLIQKPAQELYDFWRDFTNLPRFMEHLESVKPLDGDRSRWKTKGPAGMDVEWEAEIIDDVPGERITWRSVEGSDVANDGTVRFTPQAGGDGTEVRVSMGWLPPGGKLGAAVARVWGENPDRQVQDDLRRFKQMMEAGEVPTVEGQPTGA